MDGCLFVYFFHNLHLIYAANAVPELLTIFPNIFPTVNTAIIGMQQLVFSMQFHIS